MGGVEVYRARRAFTANGESWREGTYVIPLAQVFGRYAKDLLRECRPIPPGNAKPPATLPTVPMMFRRGRSAASLESRRFSRMSRFPPISDWSR